MARKTAVVILIFLALVGAGFVTWHFVGSTAGKPFPRIAPSDIVEMRVWLDDDPNHPKYIATSEGDRIKPILDALLEDKVDYIETAAIDLIPNLRAIHLMRNSARSIVIVDGQPDRFTILVGDDIFESRSTALRQAYDAATQWAYSEAAQPGT